MGFWESGDHDDYAHSNKVLCLSADLGNPLIYNCGSRPVGVNSNVSSNSGWIAAVMERKLFPNGEV